MADNGGGGIIGDIINGIIPAGAGLESGGDPSQTPGAAASNAASGAVDDIGSAIADAFKGLAGPITTWVAAKEAALLNTLNEIFNSAYYGFLALSGGLLLAWGLYEVGKDAGVDAGAPIKAAAGVASLVIPEARAAKAVTGASAAKSVTPKVSTPKAVKSAPKVSAPAPKKMGESAPGARESAARKAGMGAAQILKARREDAGAK